MHPEFKKYYEMLAILIGGLTYGLGMQFMENDWHAVFLAGFMLLFFKILITHFESK